MLTKLYDPNKGQMQVAGLMSGSGSNIKKLIELERKLINANYTSPFHLAVIFTDNLESNAVTIGREYNLPVIVRDIKSYYLAKKLPKKDMNVRAEFDSETVKALEPYNISVAAYGGYMSIASEPLINAFLGVNVHPADLSIMHEDKRKYTGDHAVRDAILAGEIYIRSSTHIVEKKVDGGKILMMSTPLEVVLEDGFNPSNSELVKQVAEMNQERLKKAGDWVIFPHTIFYISQGLFSKDENNALYFNNVLIPNGINPQRLKIINPQNLKNKITE